jgi:uncharacterized protein YegL
MRRLLVCLLLDTSGEPIEQVKNGVQMAGIRLAPGSHALESTYLRFNSEANVPPRMADLAYKLSAIKSEGLALDANAAKQSTGSKT